MPIIIAGIISYGADNEEPVSPAEPIPDGCTSVHYDGATGVFTVYFGDEPTTGEEA